MLSLQAPQTFQQYVIWKQNPVCAPFIISSIVSGIDVDYNKILSVVSLITRQYIKFVRIMAWFYRIYTVLLNFPLLGLKLTRYLFFCLLKFLCVEKSHWICKCVFCFTRCEIQNGNKNTEKVCWLMTEFETADFNKKAHDTKSWLWYLSKIIYFLSLWLKFTTNNTRNIFGHHQLLKLLIEILKE